MIFLCQGGHSLTDFSLARVGSRGTDGPIGTSNRATRQKGAPPRSSIAAGPMRRPGLMRDKVNYRASGTRLSHGLSAQDMGAGARRSRPTFGLRLKSDAGFQYFGVYTLDDGSSSV